MADGDSRSTFGAILTIAGGIVLALGSGGTLTPAVAAWWGVSLGILGGVLQYSGARLQYKEAQERARQANNSQTFKTNISGGAEHHMLVFGEARVGGIIVAAGTDGTNGVNLNLGIAHSLCHAGGCEGVTDVWLNEVKIPIAQFNLASGIYTANTAPFTDFVQFEPHLGLGTQAADTILTAAGIDPPNTNPPAPYRRGIAWTRFRLIRDMTSDENFRKAFPRGIPTLTVKLKGIKVYDPRLDETNGGVPGGPHRLATPTTWQWSGGGGGSSDIGRNPALCAATYMIMAESDGGMGYATSRINWASVAAAATICEGTINPFAVAQRRYRCDGILSTADKRSTNLEHILAAMQGVVVRVGTQFYMYAGGYDSISATITEDWLRGPVSHSTKDPIESLYNSVRVSMDRAANDYRPDEIPAFLGANEASNYETQDGGQRLWQDVNLRMVSDLYCAEYIAAIRGRRSRLQSSIELQLNLRGLQLKVWDTVTVTLPEVGASQVFRVMNWTWEESGPKVSLREESVTIYGDDNTYSLIDAAGNLVETVTLPAPTSVTATAVADGIIVSFVPPSLSLVHVVEIWRSATSGGTYTKIATVSPGNTQYKDPITDGSEYFYKVRAMTAKYQPGVYSSIVSATAKTVANGADVTADNALSFVLNPSFEAGDIHWQKTTGWSIGNDIGTARSGSFRAAFAAQSVARQITNEYTVPVAVGEQVIAYGFLRSDTTDSSRGNARVRIVWKDIDENEISVSVSSDVSPTVTYTQARVVGTAPAGAATASMQWLVNASCTAGTWYADDAYLVAVQRNQSEVPDGGGRGSVDSGYLDASRPVVNLSQAIHSNLTLQYILDGGGYGRLVSTELQSGEHLIGIANSGFTVGDSRNLVQVHNGGLPTTSAPMLTGFNNGDIDVAAHTLRLGGVDITYNAVTDAITGKANDSTWWIATDDPTYAGGTRTYTAYSTAYAAVNADGRYLLGAVTIPPAAGAPNGGGYGSDCVAADQWITGTRRARDMQPGDVIRCRSDKGKLLVAPIESIEFAIQPCVKVLTEHGAQLVCSTSTPFTLGNGLSRNVTDMEGAAVLVQRGMVRAWEKVVDVAPAGDREVARIHVGGHSYLAGDSPRAMIYSHNPVKP